MNVARANGRRWLSQPAAALPCWPGASHLLVMIGRSVVAELSAARAHGETSCLHSLLQELLCREGCYPKG